AGRPRGSGGREGHRARRARGSLERAADPGARNWPGCTDKQAGGREEGGGGGGGRRRTGRRRRPAAAGPLGSRGCRPRSAPCPGLRCPGPLPDPGCAASFGGI
ncbi:unnamed protein product, partial [Prorocentrum cordatum]